MTRGWKRCAVIAGCVFVGVLAGSGGLAADEKTAAAPAGTVAPQEMGGIFQAVQALLLIGLDGERWASAKSREDVEAALRVLEKGSAELESHEDGDSESFGFYSRALSGGIADLQQRYRNGDFERSRGQLFHLVDTCVGCHARNATPEDSRLSMGFARDPRVAALPLDERVRLETATRQYDAALATYDEIFRSKDYTASDLDMIGILDDYLALNFQVRADRAVLRRNLQAIEKRPDASPGLAADIGHWIEVLDDLPDLDAPARLSVARGLVGSARESGEGRGDRPGLVEYLAAATLLHAIVDDGSRDSFERAEAYYWLGVVESNVGSVFWPAPEEFYLESSIRLAPGSSIAARAYALLEEIVTLGYTGSGGTRIPDDIRDRLEALRKLSASGESGAKPPGVS